jgi:hypothetical protein
MKSRSYSLAVAVVAVVGFLGAWGGGTVVYQVFTGGTITQALNISAVTNDITTPGSEDLRLSAGGSVVLKDGDNNVDIEDSAGVVKGQMSTNTGASTFSLSQNLSSGSRVRLGTSAGLFGRIDDASASTSVAFLADGLDTSGGGNGLLVVYGAGLTATNTPQTCDCGTAGTPNTVTCDIQSNVVWLTDGDADACTVTISETTAAAINQDVGPVVIKVVSLGGGGTFTIADSAGVIELAGGVSWPGDSVGDTLTLEYNSSGAVDAWNELGRANN